MSSWWRRARRRVLALVQFAAHFGRDPRGVEPDRAGIAAREADRIDPRRQGSEIAVLQRFEMAFVDLGAQRQFGAADAQPLARRAQPVAHPDEDISSRSIPLSANSAFPLFDRQYVSFRHDPVPAPLFL